MFSASDWEISCPSRVLPTVIMMGYSDPGASCFLQLELLHFVRIIKYPLDESKGEDNFVVGALPWDVGSLPTAASMSGVYTEWNSSRRKGDEGGCRSPCSLAEGDPGDNDSVRDGAGLAQGR